MIVLENCDDVLPLWSLGLQGETLGRCLATVLSKKLEQRIECCRSGCELVGEMEVMGGS